MITRIATVFFLALTPLLLYGCEPIDTFFVGSFLQKQVDRGYDKIVGAGITMSNGTLSMLEKRFFLDYIFCDAFYELRMPADQGRSFYVLRIPIDQNKLSERTKKQLDQFTKRCSELPPPIGYRIQRLEDYGWGLGRGITVKRADEADSVGYRNGDVVDRANDGRYAANAACGGYYPIRAASSSDSTVFST